ncbi:MAG: ATP-binding cassette domain-containing protein [Turicibacter sp.]|nr:ATP-binding cassette domain-containing protein [Turicibacter sp.]
MKCENICKAFGDRVVLKDFNLTLPSKGVVAFMAPSGSGKTTLIRMMAQLESPDNGCFRCDKNRLSVVFQEDRLIPGVSVFQNIMAVLKKGEEAKAMEWLEKMELVHAKDLLPQQLSGGMRRRAAIARAMAYGGDFLILDEPFSGLDPKTRQNIIPHIFNTDQDDRLILLITHDRQEAESLADRLIVMEGPVLHVVEDVSKSDNP